MQCDLSDLGQLDALMSRLEAEVGDIDILVNNALHLSAAPLVAMSTYFLTGARD